MESIQNPKDIIHFWFEEIEPAQWWKVDASFDQLIHERFADTHRAATHGELWHWRSEPHGRLAEILVLDQFSRNLYRNNAAAFAADPMALTLAQEAVAGAHDRTLPKAQRVFVYMPYMHSESPIIHEAAIPLFESLEPNGNLDFELRHKAIIDRFGRYPHRNTILGRSSTPEELAFLREPNSRF